MLPTDPGHIATVLVALAATELSPSQTSVGNVSNVPPPATELIAPAAKAEANAAEPCKRSMRKSKQPSAKRGAAASITDRIEGAAAPFADW